ncbi:hydrolase [Mycolicibacterium chubuense]|uniref:Cocaine esterase n=1 Tax=Mycolicibacterium chubuense TaxID=1800 RepID=A0A0J6VWL9_MYCCU|nr:CocE/NonD family hydrolase [Mycolicibacterium chubuense]KMO73888.1 Cocaine esterase [Mycolicibacterium chubuense]ORA48231.1 hydrolase [Mycolicibacterium chubuense]SPX97689.1 hydrolase, CocE/NonD family protein [Mycolicibacterium chubuense]
MAVTDAPAHDRPWRRPGSLRYALGRLRSIVRPPVEVYSPAPGSVTVHHDVPVTTRDGTVLRVNVYLPSGGDRCPVVLCAHPYGKDNHPRKRTRLPGYRIPFQYRALRQPAPVRFSALTGWEAPDPAWWTAHGFAVVNCDLRGAGTSDGVGSVLSDQEGEDVYDLIEWAAEQSWSSGAVGMLGVSYLAISQWKAAALHPPHLRAIVPWEGFTDAYRDLMRPGGIQEVGFVKLWTRELRNIRLTYDVGAGNTKHPLRDDFWCSLVPDLERIAVPALICGSFSDNNLHTRGSVRAFENISSPDRHLFTHRGGKWATFYSDEPLRTQLAFLDRHLRGGEAAPPPRVRLEVRESRDQVVEVRNESSWPLERTTWTPLYLTEGGLRGEPAPVGGSMSFDTRSSGLTFGWTAPRDVELTGPMALRLFVSADADDVDLFVGVEKWRGGTYVPFEGSYGFGRDRVSTGWLRASMRALDEEQSRPFAPVHTFTDPQKLRAAEVVKVDIALGPSATVFRRGEQLRLVMAGRWLWPRNPLTGQFPGAYERRSRGTATVHWGLERQARLLVPVID